MSKIKIVIAKKDTKRFDRWEIYQRNDRDYREKLSELNEKDQIVLLQDQYRKIETKIDTIDEPSEDIKSILNNVTRRELEVEIDIIRKYLEEIINKDREIVFRYPELFDSEFAKKIYEKKEFYINRMPIGIIVQEATNKPRQRTSIQKFVKNYISEYTPYNGILLWHGVGVGKTCAGISIAENFRDYVQASDQKLLVLTPSDTLVQTWKDEIFNVEKEEMKRKAGQIINVQCTGDRYLSELKKIDKDSFEINRREVSRLINKYYEIMGYQKLANQVNKELLIYVKNKRYKQRAVIEYFREKFSNRVIIMDEIHFTREMGSANDKVARPFLEMIARYAENVKLVLLSATPMYNISSEITWILNLLLWNDKRAPLEPEQLFEKNGIFLREYPEDKTKYETVIKIIRERSRGYISYLRSENPLTFPLKLTPWDDYIYTPDPTYQLVGGEEEEIEEGEKIKDMIFYSDNMDPWQYKNVLKYQKIDLGDDENGEIEDLPETKTGFTSKPTQASNIVFPLAERDEKDENLGEIGEKGFNECLIANASKKLDYASHVKNIDGKPFLHLQNLGKFSSKFKNIIQSIMTSKGIVFIYSQFVKAGVRALACALEANGFERYIGEGKVDNLLVEPMKDRFSVIHNKYYSELSTEEKKEFKPARYILLDGSVPKPLLNKLVKECRGSHEKPNTNGEYIKVILGTKVIETGISFLRVREIHILDPWHHLNTMEQAAGRGIRNFSHIQLPVSERNVTLFLHIASLPEGDDSGLETNDERIYRRAYLKKKNMAIIERQLKINAVDCGLNKMGNMFIPQFYEDVEDNPLTDRVIINSKGEEETMNLYDKDGSMICDFEECYYKCEPDVENVKPSEINSSTFNEFYAEDEIMLVKELIKNMFLREYVLTDLDIIENLREMKVELEDHYIYLALNDLVENKNEVIDGYYRMGYIINRINPVTKQNFYIFQPKELGDMELGKNLPMVDRYLPKPKFKKRFRLEDIKITKDSAVPKEIKPKITIKAKQEVLITDKSEFNLKKFFDFIRGRSSKDANSLAAKYSSGAINSKEIIPNLNQIRQYCIERVLDELTYLEKIELLKAVIPRLNEPINTDFNDKAPISDDLILYTILHYYDKRNKNDESYLLLRSNRDLYKKADQTIGDIEANKIVGFRIIYKELYKKGELTYEGETKIDYYLLQDGEIKKLSLFANEDLGEKLKIPKGYNDYGLNKNPIYGYLSNNNGKFGQTTITEIQILNLKFYIVNKHPDGPGRYTEKTNLDGSIQKKSERRGAKCGSAKGASLRSDFIWLVNNLLEMEKYGSGESAPSNDTIKLEIELLLRHREHLVEKTNHRFFYKYEDTLL